MRRICKLAVEEALENLTVLSADGVIFAVFAGRISQAKGTELQYVFSCWFSM